MNAKTGFPKFVWQARAGLWLTACCVVGCDNEGITLFAPEIGQGSGSAYEWRQVSGSEVVLNDPKAPNPRFVPPEGVEEDYAFEVTITDTDGSSKTLGVSAGVGGSCPPGNRPPLAVAGDAQFADPGQMVSLDAGSSTDPDNDVLSFRWRQIELIGENGTNPDSESCELFNADTPNAFVVCDDPGFYAFEAIVSDDCYFVSNAIALQVRTITFEGCDDGLFCNGEELTGAGNICIPGDRPCGDGPCDEANDECVASDPCDTVQCDAELICDNGDCVECLSDDTCDNLVFCDGVESCNQQTGLCDPGTPPCAADETCIEADEACEPQTEPCDPPACDNGVFCDGLEICDGAGCASGPRPCRANEVCNEAGQACEPAPSCNTVLVSSDFTTGTEGWTITGNGSNTAAGWGQSCECLQKQFNVGSTDIGYYSAPEKYTGDFSDAFGGLLRFRTSIDRNGSGPGPVVRIRGINTTIAYFAPAPDVGWTNRVLRLNTETPWKVGTDLATDAEIQDVLEYIVQLEIRGEYPCCSTRRTGKLDDVAIEAPQTDCGEDPCQADCCSNADCPADSTCVDGSCTAAGACSTNGCPLGETCDPTTDDCIPGARVSAQWSNSSDNVNIDINWQQPTGEWLTIDQRCGWSSDCSESALQMPEEIADGLHLLTFYMDGNGRFSDVTYRVYFMGYYFDIAERMQGRATRYMAVDVKNGLAHVVFNGWLASDVPNSGDTSGRHPLEAHLGWRDASENVNFDLSVVQPTVEALTVFPRHNWDGQGFERVVVPEGIAMHEGTYQVNAWMDGSARWADATFILDFEDVYIRADERLQGRAFRTVGVDLTGGSASAFYNGWIDADQPGAVALSDQAFEVIAGWRNSSNNVNVDIGVTLPSGEALPVWRNGWSDQGFERANIPLSVPIADGIYAVTFYMDGSGRWSDINFAVALGDYAFEINERMLGRATHTVTLDLTNGIVTELSNTWRE